MEPVSVARCDRKEFHEIRTACFGRVFFNRQIEPNDVEPTHVPDDWPKSICEMPEFPCTIPVESTDEQLQSLVDQMQELVPELIQQKKEINQLRETIADQVKKMEQLENTTKYIQKLVMSHQSRILEQSVAQFFVSQTKTIPAPPGLSLCEPSTSGIKTKKLSFNPVVESLIGNSIPNPVKGEEVMPTVGPKSILKAPIITNAESKPIDAEIEEEEVIYEPTNEIQIPQNRLRERIEGQAQGRRTNHLLEYTQILYRYPWYYEYPILMHIYVQDRKISAIYDCHVPMTIMSPEVATWENQSQLAVKKCPIAIGPGEDDVYFAYIPWRNIEIITRIRTRYTIPFVVRGRIRNYCVPIEAYLVPSWSDGSTPPTVILGRNFGERYVTEVNMDPSTGQGTIVLDEMATSLRRPNRGQINIIASVFQIGKRIIDQYYDDPTEAKPEPE